MTGKDKLLGLVPFLKFQKNKWLEGLDEDQEGEAIPSTVICERDGGILCTLIPNTFLQKDALEALGFLHMIFPLDAAILVIDARMKRVGSKEEADKLNRGDMATAAKSGNRDGVVDCLLAMRIDRKSMKLQMMTMPYETFESSTVYWGEPVFNEESTDAKAMGWMAEVMRHIFSKTPNLTPILDMIAGRCGLDAKAEREKIDYHTFRAVSKELGEHGINVVLPNDSKMGITNADSRTT